MQKAKTQEIGFDNGQLWNYNIPIIIASLNVERFIF